MIASERHFSRSHLPASLSRMVWKSSMCSIPCSLRPDRPGTSSASTHVAPGMVCRPPLRVNVSQLEVWKEDRMGWVVVTLCIIPSASNGWMPRCIARLRRRSSTVILPSPMTTRSSTNADASQLCPNVALPEVMALAQDPTTAVSKH